MPSMTVGSADFAIASDSTCLSSLADQATCTLNIVFTPSATGVRNGTLTVNSSAENSPLTFSLTGTGLQATPVLSLSTTPLSFGSQLLNTSSGTNSVVLTNSGSAPLTIFGVALPGISARRIIALPLQWAASAALQSRLRRHSPGHARVSSRSRTTSPVARNKSNCLARERISLSSRRQELSFRPLSRLGERLPTILPQPRSLASPG